MKPRAMSRGFSLAWIETTTQSGHRAPYAAVGLRTPNALIARSSMSMGSRSPVAVTLTIDFAISSVIGSAQIDEDEMDRTVGCFGGDRVGLRIE
jgi:hypothetical protein